MNQITAVILAQGENTRIGLEKSLLKLSTGSIIENEVRLLKKIFDKIIIISRKIELKNKFPDLDFFDDKYKNIGPLGGIHSALSQTGVETIFVFACDMPNLSKRLILSQINFFLKTGADIVVPRHIEGIEPLHAIYTKKCLKNIEDNIKKKNYSIRAFYSGLNLKYFDVTPDKIKYFFNINTLNDYRRVKDKHF